MNTIEIVLLVCIIVLFVYIVYRLLYRKRKYLFREGATDNTPKTKDVMDNSGNSVIQIEYPPSTAFNDSSNLPLKEYAIYASFNSAYDGTTNTLEQLGKVMYEGCRFIDLNVFQVNEKYYVGFAKDNAPTLIETSLPLSKVIDYINGYAFAIDTKIGDKVKASYITMMQNGIQTNAADKETLQKNYINYPMFVNIRLYRSPDSTTDIATGVLKTLTGKDGLRNLYVDGEGDTAKAIPVNQFTPLKDLSKKIILSIDYQNILQLYAAVGDNIYDAKNISVETLKQINTSVNIQIGHDNWQAFYTYADADKSCLSILEHKDTTLDPNHSYETNTRVMRLAYPYFNELSNPDSYSYIAKHKIQTVPNRFYIDDANLTKYNKLFYEHKTPFVPLYYAKTYIAKNP